jgi:hypothetical protein
MNCFANGAKAERNKEKGQIAERKLRRLVSLVSRGKVGGKHSEAIKVDL